MKYLFIVAFVILSLTSQAQSLKPYCMGVESRQSLEQTIQLVKTQLLEADLDILGEYQPANDANRWLIIIGSAELNKAVSTVGGLTGFALTQRIAFTRKGSTIQVSYTNPSYWGNAYFQDDYPKVQVQYSKLRQKVETAMRNSGSFNGRSFGSEKGVEIDDLREYQYMFGMPEFVDTDLLGKFSSHRAAINTIERNFSKTRNVSKVYEIELPGREIKLYGVALGGAKGESSFLPIIDISEPKHTAFLPYEFLVVGKEVHLLTGRYRIALSFPDLSMKTFTKIISTPGDIETAVKQLTKQ